MLLIYLLINLTIQYNLEWQISDSQLTLGQYTSEVRIYSSDRSVFKSQFTIFGNMPLNPQNPIARVNTQYVSFKVGFTETSGTLLTLTLSTNPQYQLFSNQLSFVPQNKVCLITPTYDFDTIPFGGKRAFKLNFGSCVPVYDLQIVLLQDTISTTVVLKSREQYLNLDISASTAVVGSIIQVTFTTNSTYYQINPLNFKVIETLQTPPVVVLKNKNSGSCVGSSGVFSFGCGKKAVLYYSYTYQNQQITLDIIKKQLNLKNTGFSYTNCNNYEGYGSQIITDSNEKQISLTGLRSNSNYIINSFCEDEVSQQQNVQITFTRCDNSLIIQKLSIYSYQIYQTINIRDIVCDIMIQQQLNQQQVSSEDGIFCDKVAQQKLSPNKIYQSTKTSKDLITYTFFIYPDYSSQSTQIVKSFSIVNYQIDKFLIETYQPILPDILQEFFITNEKQLNLTISLTQDGYIEIGLDFVQKIAPDYYQFSKGLNSLGNPLLKFKSKFLKAKTEFTFISPISDNNEYQLMYVLKSDPQGTKYSTLKVRQFKIDQFAEALGEIIVLSVYLLFFI